MTVSSITLVDELADKFGASIVSAPGRHDAVDGLHPLSVIKPNSSEGIAEFLEFAAQRGVRVAPRGGGTKMDWGNAPRELDVILSTERLNRVVEHAWSDMTATVQAGCTISKFQETLNEHGQYLALDPLWPDLSTIGGVLATNDSGAYRLRFGALRDLVIGITIALPGGVLAKSGGKVVKNVAGYDLQKLLTGSFGTLGIITEATFRLYPTARATRTLSFVAPEARLLNQLTLAIHDSKLTPTGLQVVGGSGHKSRLDVRLDGVEAAINAQTEYLGVLVRDLKKIEHVDSPPEAWNAREQLWGNGKEEAAVDSSKAVICKATFLPSELGRFFSLVERVASASRLEWQIAAQSIGIGTLRLDGLNPEPCIEGATSLRRELLMTGGSLVVLSCASEAKAGMDVWGAAGDALPLMRRVKEMFDPTGVLNPGRFVGGI